MLRVYMCVVYEHDLRLVGLAVFICALASFAAVSLLHHVAGSERSARWFWLTVATIATGVGIWATHFIAMLAFQPPVPHGYHLGLTMLSLVLAVGVTGAGLSVATRRLRHGQWIGGVIVGSGIAAMHYTGMTAFELAGRIEWAPLLVAASVAFSMLLGAAALPTALRANALRWKLLGALVLTLAICAHHFTAMGAAVIHPDPRVAISGIVIPAGWLAVVVAFASIAILVLALAGLALDLRDARRAGEARRMLELADAAVEGLVVYGEGKIVAANKSFARLACPDGSSPTGVMISRFFPAAGLHREEERSSVGDVREETLCATDGTMIPVELICQGLAYGGLQRQVIAVRDLRERKEAEAALQFLAYHDPLTGLLNRTRFEQCLEEALDTHRGSDEWFALLFIDLDCFKDINDQFGHTIGDAALQATARAIVAAAGARGAAARLGGDEFAVIVPALKSAAGAAGTAQAILDAIAGADSALRLSASIGIALFPDDADNRAALLNHADVALYTAKSAGRGVWRLFEDKLIEHRRAGQSIKPEARRNFRERRVA